MNRKLSTLNLAIVAALAASSSFAANFESPDSVENTIAQQKSQQLDWRESLAADGFTFGDHLQITPDIQYIEEPAFSNESSAWVFGIRARVFI